ncbi:MAG: hypothetical protein LBU88_04855, partial [Treponema sp.]|nr:hypothetical protein [Treponema sp.]
MKENINENMDITGLQLTNVKMCNIVNNEFVPVPEMADNSLAQSIVENTAIPDGEAYIAEADVFSQEDIPVEIALLDDGSQISNLDFSA